MSRNWEKRSIRQIDPAFIAAIAGRIGRFVDEFRNVVENAAISLLVVVIDKGLPSDEDYEKAKEFAKSMI